MLYTECFHYNSQIHKSIIKRTIIGVYHTDFFHRCLCSDLRNVKVSESYYFKNLYDCILVDNLCFFIGLLVLSRTVSDIPDRLETNFKIFMIRLHHNWRISISSEVCSIENKKLLKHFLKIIHHFRDTSYFR